MIDTISPKWTIEIHKVFNYSWRWDFYVQKNKIIIVIYDQDKVVLQDGFNQAIGSAIKWIKRYMSNS